jgi:hypothetical protein
MPTARNGRDGLDALVQKMEDVRTGLAVLQASTGELTRSLRQLRSEVVTRPVCAAKHKALNGFMHSGLADRRARWPLYVVGIGVAVNAVIGIVNLIL